MKHDKVTTHTYELDQDEITQAIIDYVIARQKALNKANPQEAMIHLNAYPTRAVTIFGTADEDATPWAIVRFTP